MNIKLLEMMIDHGEPDCAAWSDIQSGPRWMVIKLLVDDYQLEAIVKATTPGRNSIELIFNGEFGVALGMDEILEFVGKLFIELSDRETGVRRFILDEGQSNKNRASG